jgi:preprotein translocase subunit YajC
MLALIIVVFYMFMIRPQMKRQKELRKFQEALQKGDKVIVSGGVFGKIADIKEDHLLVEIADNVRIKVVKSTVLRDSSDLQQK